MTAVLGVLLFLLKCLGILLLVLFGLLLLVLVLVLLAPVRYRGVVRKKEEPEEVFFADGLVSWLNPFLRVRIKYTEKKFRYTVRIFGIGLLNSEKPKKGKGKKAKREKPKKNKKDKKEVPEAHTQTVRTAEGSAVSETAEVSGKSDRTQTVPRSEAAEDAEGLKPQERTAKKESFFAKIRKFVEKVKAIPEKIKEKIVHIYNTLKLLWHKREKGMLFLQDELHILAIGKAWNALKKVLRHVLPGKVKGHVEFGSGDPQSTGKALAVLGILYAAYGKGLTIVPDFYEKRLVMELTLKGRIRFGTLLRLGLGFIRDKQVKRFYRDLKKLIKVLKQKAE